LASATRSAFLLSSERPIVVSSFNRGIIHLGPGSAPLTGCCTARRAVSKALGTVRCAPPFSSRGRQRERGDGTFRGASVEGVPAAVAVGDRLPVLLTAALAGLEALAVFLGGTAGLLGVIRRALAAALASLRARLAIFLALLTGE
jgi:hypothetical protein